MYLKRFTPKHLQKCFRAVDFLRLGRGCKNVIKKFYFTFVTTVLLTRSFVFFCLR